MIRLDDSHRSDKSLDELTWKALTVKIGMPPLVCQWLSSERIVPRRRSAQSIHESTTEARPSARFDHKKVKPLGIELPKCRKKCASRLGEFTGW